MSSDLILTSQTASPLDTGPWHGARQTPSSMPFGQYVPYEPIGLADRTWPGKRLERAPLWCSVDLRDGNQALLDPMDLRRKQEMFELLVRMGFKEIEIGYPTSSKADQEFIRYLIDEDAVPEDVTVQVMVSMRPDLIRDTVRIVDGLPKVIMQVLNPLSVAQRRAVFKASREQTKKLALDGAELAMRLRDGLRHTEIALQYAPESFTQAEPEFALEVCNSVLELWRPAPADDIRIVVPSTVECFGPDEFADRIEWMHRNLLFRKSIMLGVHPHNDRGTAVAAAELAVMAGADRVDGTLFGNGERTGNVCLITLAMNLFSHGVDPMLELGDIDEIKRVVERCNLMPVGARHPYGGDLVYTSFAGSHQDAISKGLRDQENSGREHWDVPYLPVNPNHIGRDYQALIRINNQSGKGGLAYLLRSTHGLDLPRRMQIELAAVVQQALDEDGGELTAQVLWTMFEREYLAPGEHADDVSGSDGEDALAQIAAANNVEARLLDTVSHSIEGGKVGCYCEVQSGSTTKWGAGVAPSIEQARVWALTVALSRAAGITTKSAQSGPFVPVHCGITRPLG